MQCYSLLPKPAVLRYCVVLEYLVSEQHVYLIPQSSVALIHIFSSLLRSFPSLPTPIHLPVIQARSDACVYIVMLQLL